MYSGIFSVMLTLSDHYISANSAAADQLCDVAVIWAAAICCRLPDFTPYLLTLPVFPPWLLHSLIFSRLLSASFCLLSEDEAVNEISDGGWGKPWPEARRTFQPFLFFGWSDKVRVTFSQSGRKTKAEQAFLCPPRPPYNTHRSRSLCEMTTCTESNFMTLLQ